MESYRQEIILLSILTYMGFCIVIGMWAMRRTNSAQDFFMAGRNLGPIIVALALFSSTLSGFGFVGGPGLIYSLGVSSIWMANVSALGYAVGFFLVAKRIRMIAELHNTISLPAVVAVRYQSDVARALMAIVILLGVMGYLATQILAMALVLKVLLNATPWLTGISLVTCVIISSAVLVFYCVTGGIIASVYTDVVQGSVMIVAGVLVMIAAGNVFDGGLAGASAVVLADNSEAIMPFGAAGIITCLGWFFIFGMGLSGQPHLITKMMMSKNISDNRSILPMSVISYALAALLWISVGVVMRALVVDGQVDPLNSPDDAVSFFLSNYANPILAGVVFSGLFAAIMSTSDAFLNIGTAAVIHDLPLAICGKTIDNELYWARIVTLILAVLAAAVALFSFYVNDNLVALLGTFGWGTFAAAIVPVVVIGLNWSGANTQGAITAIVSSIAINFAIQLFSIELPYDINGSFVAMVVSMFLFIVVSMLTKRQKLPYDIERMMQI